MQEPRLADFTFPSADTVECPYPFYETMRREEPVHKLPGEDVYFISRWEDIAFVAEHPELFSPERPVVDSLGAASVQGGRARGQVSDTGLSQCNGPEHRLKRSSALKLVSPGRLRRHREFIATTVDDLLDGFIGDGEVEFSSQFAAPLPMAVICEMLGVPRDDDLFGRVMDQVPTSAVRFLSAAARESRALVSTEMHAYMEQVIRERDAAPRDDFLSEFIAEHRRRTGELPLEYLITEATTLLFGGLVTTQHMFTNTMELLLRSPAEMRRVVDDRSLIRPMLEESLRIESPFHLTETICTADTEIDGVMIPAGSAVYKVWGSGNRDEEKFPHADQFRIGRPAVAKTHLGFGRGSHRCLGAPLALLEGTIGFQILLERCGNLRFAPGRNDWRHVPAISFRSLRQLHLTFEAP